ncbi:MAG: methyltransferase small [bacterium]|nr:MAG: methyltransferase small [bacterium]
MRIVGGAARGLKIAGPGRVKSIRPTPDKVREALFNMIDVENAAFLDLFAGTGAIGCEAISRGAALVTAVENNRRAIGIIKKNVESVKSATGDKTETEIWCIEAARFLKRTHGERKYDVIFCDPPYNWDGVETFFEKIHKESSILKSGGVFILEASYKNIPQTCTKPDKTRRYGDTVLLFYK